MTKDQQEIRRKLRVLNHAAECGDVSKTVTSARPADTSGLAEPVFIAGKTLTKSGAKLA